MGEEKNAKKLSISVDDLNSAQVDSLVEHIQKAKEVPLVREVGDSRKNRGGSIALLWFGLAGAIGGFLTWVVWSVLPEPTDVQQSNIQAAVSVGLVIGLALVITEAIQTGSAEKAGRSLLIAVPAGLALSLLFGFLADGVYSELIDRTVESLYDSGLDPSEDTFWVEFQNQNHLNRGIAWAILGLATGLMVGISSLAWKRVAVTSAGGVVGGFLGGFLFDFFEGEDLAQITGLAVTGIAIGASIGLIEQVAKSSWLEIVQGGMAGKQFILYKDQITIGSSPSADVTLIKDPAIGDLVARIERRGSATIISSLDGMNPVIVDQIAISKTQLGDGAEILLGATLVRFREKSSNSVNSGVVRG